MVLAVVCGMIFCGLPSTLVTFANGIKVHAKDSFLTNGVGGLGAGNNLRK